MVWKMLKSLLALLNCRNIAITLTDLFGQFSMIAIAVFDSWGCRDIVQAK